MKEKEVIKKLLRICKIKIKRNDAIEGVDSFLETGIGFNLSFSEDEFLFDIIFDIVGFPEDNTNEFERPGTNFPEGKRTDYENMFSRDYVHDPLYDFLNDYNEDCVFQDDIFFESEDELIDWLYSEKSKL